MTETRGAITATTDDWAHLSGLADLCRRTVAEWNHYTARTRWTIHPESRYAWERAQLRHQPSPTNYTWTNADLDHAAGSSLLFLTVARQHLLALADLIERGHVMFSLAPTIRSTIEHLARVAWALDPRCRPRERLARVFWTRHDDLYQSRKLAKSFDNTHDIETYSVLYKQLRRQTLPAMFWPSEIDRDINNNIVAVCGQSLPGFSASIAYLSDIYEGRDDWGTAEIYNFLSANTHPTPQIYRSRLQPSASVSDDDTARAEDSVERVRLGLDNLDEPRDLTYLALRCYVQMWRLIVGYHGLDPDAAEIMTIAAEVDALRTT